MKFFFIMDTKINTIWQKLLQIQKKYATFAITEPSDKTNKNGDAEYKYTPNWQIIEPIRKELDAMGIMLITDIEDVTTQIVEYPIYRINPKNEIVSFLKKDTLSTVKMTYYFIDTNTGECTPVMRMIATDANGIDKSTSSAISLAERYIFLKFFHITTRERSESNDSHISTTQEIGDILPVVKSYMDKYKESVDACDGMVQKWNLSKTMWKERAEKLGTIMEKLMTNAGIKKWISDGITASLTTRTNLEVIDPEVLLAPFRPMIQQLAVSLPPYVKVDIKLGKKELSTIVKTDNTLLLSDPENIHYKDSVTFGLK